MSIFSICLDQITRPSFLPNLGTPSRRPSQPIAAEKRRQVLACIECAAESVSSTWVMDYTGYTKQSVMHLLYALSEAGEIRRIEGGAVLLWGKKQ